MTAAFLYVRRPSGAVDPFVAEDCVVVDGLVTATGRFRSPSGRLDAEARSYTWPSSRVEEIRWGATA